MVTEQIANLSAGNRRPGSNPGLSAKPDDLVETIPKPGVRIGIWDLEFVF